LIVVKHMNRLIEMNHHYHSEGIDRVEDIRVYGR
jgi:hypothetical protein